MRTIASVEVRDASATVGSVLEAVPGAASGFHEQKDGARWVQRSDQLEGQAKEAAGTLTGNKDLKSEGKADRRAGEAKDRVGHARDKIEEMIDDVEAKGKGVVDKAKDALHRK
jgi:uncharacterized protein YjbJ (UPF0337 family)